MNAIFNPKRFFWLEKYKMPETIAHTFLCMAIVACIYFVMLFWAYNYGFKDQIYAHRVLSLSFLMMVLSPCLFERTMNKYNSVVDFILPVPTIERFVHLLLKYVLYIPIVCFTTLIVVNLILSLFGTPQLTQFATLNIESFTRKDDQIWAFMIMQPLFFTGYFLFRDKVLLKSILLLTIFLFGCFFITEISSELFMPNNKGELWVRNLLTISVYNFSLSDSKKLVLNICTYIIPCLFVIGLWIASFLLLREKEI